MGKVIVLLAALALAGCANYVSDYDQYATAHKEFVDSNGTTIKAMLIASHDAMSAANDPTAKALIAMMTQQQISAVAGQRFQLVKPTTWTDFWSGAWPTIAGAVPYIGIGYVANQGFKNAGGNNYLNAQTMDVQKSFNASEVHMTGSSQGAITAPFMQEANHTYNGPVTQQ
jgi:hypothetical protein